MIYLAAYLIYLKVIDLVEAYQNHKKAVFTYIYLCVNKNRDIAEDILQDTFLKAFKYKDKYNSQLSSEKTWILAIARNLVTDYYKSKYKYKHEDLDKAEDLGHSEDINIENELVYKEILKALESLSDKDKELIILRYVNELEIKEIADILNIKYDNVKVSINRALNKLRELIK